MADDNDSALFTVYSFNVQPPKVFDFSKPKTWPIWIKRFQRYISDANLTTESTLADPVERMVIEYSDSSLTVLWPFSDLALLWLRTIKKHLKHCNYDFAIKFELAIVGINTIILLFRDKNQKNIVYLSLKAVQWFTIGGTSSP